MALVLLPCDLPTWPTVQRHLNQLKQATTSNELVDGMNKLHNLCCVGLDPDEDQQPDAKRFDGLKLFLDEVLSTDERQQFFDITLPSLVTNALRLKSLKPVCGLHFSLQQQADQVTLERPFLTTLIANAFFSTFPKRTMKTHPTLQDFNFGQFFEHLDRCEQQMKLRNIFHYFDQAVSQELTGHVTLSRKVLPKWEKPSLDDWLDSAHPLCPLIVRREGRVEDSEIGCYQICATSSKIGNKVLTNGVTQDEAVLCTCPELLVTLLYVESLEANESMSAHNWIKVGQIHESRKFCPLGVHGGLWDSHLSMIDAGNYRECPLSQYKEENILRELTKAYLGFQQPKYSPTSRLSPVAQSCSPPSEQTPTAAVAVTVGNTETVPETSSRPRKPSGGGFVNLVKAASAGDAPASQLVTKVTTSATQVSPRRQRKSSGESVSHASPTPPLASSRKGLPSTLDSGVGSQEVSCALDSAKLSEKLSLLTVPEIRKFKKRILSEASEASFKDALSTQSSFCSIPEEEAFHTPSDPVCIESLSSSSSTLVSDIRPLTMTSSSSNTATTPSSSNTMIPSFAAAAKRSESQGSDEEEDYQSCYEDLDDEEPSKYSHCVPGPDLISSRGRWLLAESLKGQMKRSGSAQSEMEDSSFSLDIHIAGPDIHDDQEEIRVRRVPSTGFLLEEDDNFFGASLESEQAWLRQFRQRSVSRSASRCNSSRYSFSSDFSSDLEDIYEHFEEMMKEGPVADDPAVAKYVGGLLKRTLSDSLTVTRHNPGTVMPRSLSLADHLTQERLALEHAKQKLDIRGFDPSPPMSEATDDVSVSSKPGELVSIGKKFAEVEEKIALEFPKDVSDKVKIGLQKLYNRLSFEWNNNEAYVSPQQPSELQQDAVSFSEPQNNSPTLVDSGFVDNCPVSPSKTPTNNSQSPTGCSDDSLHSVVASQPFSLSRWKSRSDSNLKLLIQKSQSSSSHSGFKDGGMRKWDAKADLNERRLMQSGISEYSKEGLNVDYESSVDYESNTGSKVPDFYSSLESLCPRPWVQDDTDADSDQFWLVINEDADSDDDTPRERAQSFGSLFSQDHKSLRRASSDPHSLSDLGFHHKHVSSSLGHLSRHDVFSTLQPIAEVKEPESANSGESVTNFGLSSVFAKSAVESSGSTNSSTDVQLKTSADDQETGQPSADIQSVSSADVEPKFSETTESTPTEDNGRDDAEPARRLFGFDIYSSGDGFRPVATSNWGCGDYAGDPQLKVVIQWLAASRADAPCLLYYMAGNENLLKLDTVSRILRDRHWTVGNLAKAMVTHCTARKDGSYRQALFDDILPKDMHQLSWSSTKSEQSCDSLD